jgi:2-aminoadipate transaminase
MSLARRQALLKLAAEYDFLIIEDDAYGELRFEGEPVPSLKALDTGMRVIQTGTFSKVIAPGVRLGWAIGPTALIEEMGHVNVGGGLSTFVEGILFSYCRDGDLDARIDDLRGQYRTRKDAMVASLETHMPAGVTWNNPEGGFFLWLEVPAEVDMDKLAGQARDMGVTYVGGSAFFTDGRGKNYARLCFSFCTPEQLDRAVGVIAQLIKDEMTAAGATS